MRYPKQLTERIRFINMTLTFPHHSDIQCASSITTSETANPPEITDRNSSFKNRSGETKSTCMNYNCNQYLSRESSNIIDTVN